MNEAQKDVLLEEVAEMQVNIDALKKRMDRIEPDLNPLIQQAKDEYLTVRIKYKGEDEYLVGKILTHGTGFHRFDSAHKMVVQGRDTDIVEIVTWTEETPLGEQVWQWESCDGGASWRILTSDWDTALAKAYSESMRDVILGIPALVKACREHTGDIQDPGVHRPIVKALEAMGVDK